jgi:hypothetical protein
MNDEFDFWYAVNNTEVVKAPQQSLETFGTTVFHYHLITELLDSVNQIRVREGRLEAAQPQIITPGDFGDLPLDGFENAQSAEYVDWLRQNQQDLRLIQYGFNITKKDIKSFVVSESREQVVDNVKETIRVADDPLSAIIVGVDEPWEVCLLKLMIDLVEQSAAGNVHDFQQQHLLPMGPDDLRKEIDRKFLEASRNPGLVQDLHQFLQQNGIFGDYEDRFFALVRASQE